MKLSSLLAVLLALVLSPLCGAQSRPKSPPPKSSVEKSALSLPFDDARRMTLLVRIKGRFENLGSAVWVGKTGYLATCYHVVRGVPFPLIVAAPRDPIFAPGVDLVITGTVNPIDATVVAWDESTDVAILKAAQPPGQPLTPTVTGNAIGVTETLWISKGANLATAIPNPGETVLLAGYPLNQSTLILQTGNTTGEGDFYQGSIPSAAEPSSSGRHRPPFTNGRRIMLSVVSNPGNSGGPVFDHDGNVVGLLEGNLLSSVTVMADPAKPQIPLLCSLPKVDASGAPLLDADHNPIIEKYVSCVQNSGISMAVPAMFISDLAKRNNLDLR